MHYRISRRRLLDRVELGKFEWADLGGTSGQAHGRVNCGTGGHNPLEKRTANTGIVMIGEAINEFYPRNCTTLARIRRKDWNEPMALSGNRLRRWQRRQNKFCKVWELFVSDNPIASELFQFDLATQSPQSNCGSTCGVDNCSLDLARLNDLSNNNLTHN